MHWFNIQRILLVVALGLGVVALYTGATLAPGGPAQSRVLFEHLGQRDTLRVALTIAGVVAAYLLVAAAGAMRWRVLLRAVNIRLSFHTLWLSWLAGGVFYPFLPFGIGRDVYRICDASAASGRAAANIVAVLAEKLAGIISFFFLMAVALPLGLLALDPPVAKLRGGIVILAITVAALVSLMILAQPRVIRVLLSLPPWPARIQGHANEAAAAMAAIASRRGTIVAAVAWGFATQCATVFMVYAVLRTLFVRQVPEFAFAAAAPLVWADPIIGFSLVRQTFGGLVHERWLAEAVATSVVAAVAAWWFIRGGAYAVGLIALVFRGFRPSSVTQTAAPPAPPHALLSAADRLRYAAALGNTWLAGAAGGLLGGGVIGLVEAGWIYGYYMGGAPELRMMWWAPLAYGLLFAPFGLAVALASSVAYLALDRFRVPGATAATAFASSVAAGFLVLGRYHYARDVLDDHPLNAREVAVLLAITLVLFVLLDRAGGLLLGKRRPRRLRAAAAVATAWVLLIGGGALFGSVRAEPQVRDTTGPAVAADGPPVVFIVIDTLRADYLPIYAEDAPALTPHLDAFAEDAVVFRHSIAQASWTKPSFATMFTGLYPAAHGAMYKSSVLPASVRTLAEVMRDAGYMTQGFPNNRNLLPVYGLDQGFSGYDFLMPRLYFGATFSVERLALYEVLRRVRLGAMAPAVEIEHFYAPAATVTDRVGNWLAHESPEDAPFLLYMHYMDPHDPYMRADRPGEGFASMRLGLNPDPDVYRAPIRDAYIDEVERVDAALGALFAQLQELRIYDDALIVVTSDHGEEIYDHYGWSHGPTVYDEVIHVPLVIKLPGNVGGGAVTDTIARHVDLMPTILQITRTAGPIVLPGRSLFDTSGAITVDEVDAAFAETDFLGTVAQTLRTRERKLITANPGNPRGLQPVEFYAVDSDPGETENLAGSGQPAEAHLREELATFRNMRDLPAEDERLPSPRQ